MCLCTAFDCCSACDLSCWLELLSGCLALLFSCQRHSVSHGQGLNSVPSRGDGASNGGSLFTCHFRCLPWKRPRQANQVRPLWLRGHCDADGGLNFSLFVSSPASFHRSAWVCNSCETSHMQIARCPSHVHKTCKQMRFVGTLRYACAERRPKALFFIQPLM